MKSYLRKTMVGLVCCLFGVLHAQTWEKPVLPAVSLDGLSSNAVVYFYNVETDAFLLNGMTWNTNACATRLTNGDRAISEPQRCYAYVGDGKVRVQLKNYGNKYLSCLSEKANDVYVDQEKGHYFTYTVSEKDANVYTLMNDTYGKLLDVTWNYGGHLTLVNGAGYTRWAFIPETSVTNGSYALYKSRKLLYDVYDALVATGKEAMYAEALSAAYVVYVSESATTTDLQKAARTLFETVCVELEGPLDVSFLFNNCDMAGSGKLTGWTSGTADFGWGEFEKYHASFTMTQKQTVPQGLYDVVFHSLYRQDGTDAAPTLTVTASNTISAEIPQVGSLDYQVTNTESNNWKNGKDYNQPDGMRSAAQALTHSEALVRAKNVVVDATGDMTVTASMPSANQWLNWQGFRVYYKGVGTTSLKKDLLLAIEAANAVYGDGSGKGAATLKSVIDEAQTMYDEPSASMKELAEMIALLPQAVEAYRKTSATIENPLDYSFMIENASFESGFDYWQQQHLAVQGNSAFGLKSGTNYLEKWISKGQRVGDALVCQEIQQLEMGVYVLKVAAQNIQEGSSAQQRNAWIFANDAMMNVHATDEYELTFTNIENSVTVGFKAEGATGNWLACDNFRLYYAGGNAADFKAELQRYVDNAKTYVTQKMQKNVLNKLQEKITGAEAALQKDAIDGYPEVATPLRLAVENAKESIRAYVSLQSAIEEAMAVYGDGSAKGAEKLLAAIETAQKICEDLDATKDALYEQEILLGKALFTMELENATGAIPTVTTDKRFARGSTVAFGRSKITGVSMSDLKEHGFCWSTSPEPTVLDERSTQYLNQNGYIYRMTNLTPSTVYYARAYAMTKTNAVGYGEVIKIITLPKGGITYWYNNGADAATNERISKAVASAVDYWNNLTSIKGLNLSVSFGSGTPTADCSYGGSMRVGPNTSYQRTGTILHEMLHAMGVGTHFMWYGYSPLRETGYRGLWLGDRVTEVIRFWDNNTTSQLTGDNTHMWPYGINGAHEDDGSDALYTINSLICQALCEDGLPPTGGFGLPAYVFPQEDDKTYYIRNESDNYGKTTAFLVETATGNLEWKKMSAGEALADNKAGWSITFDPKTQYYHFRNKGTGHYMTYEKEGLNGIRTAAHATPTANDRFHLMRGRVDVDCGTEAKAFVTRGYWIVHPEHRVDPLCLIPSSGGATTTGRFDIADTSVAQRWLLLDGEDLSELELSGKDATLGNLNKMIQQVRQLLQTPHVEDTEGIDESTDNALSEIAAQINEQSTLSELLQWIDEVRTLGINFLSSATPLSVATPFDVTFLIANAGMDDETGWSTAPVINHSCGEFFEKAFDMTQTLRKLPAGTFKLMVQGLHRPGDAAEVMNAYEEENATVNVLLYAGARKVALQHIGSAAQTSPLHEHDIQINGVYIPNTMLSARTYFDEGYYQNEIIATVRNKGGSLKIGVKSESSLTKYWTIFDNFRLYYYGSLSEDEVTSVEKITVTEPAHRPFIYTLQGVCVGDKMENLPQGIYIRNGKKVLKK